MKSFTSRGAVLRYAEVGEGRAVLALHGAYSTHEEIRAVLEPSLARRGYRRLYPDLPGMGASDAHDSIQTSNDIVDVLDDLIHAEVGRAPVLLVGQSYGAHLARGLCARRGDQVAGLALICPLLRDGRTEPHTVIDTSDEATRSVGATHVGDYTGYFVIQTPTTAQRFRAAVVPALGRWDNAAVERVMASWELAPDPDVSTYQGPTIVLTGRHDSFAGYRDQLALLDRYPRARYVAVADAGHALPHEHPDLVARLIDDWLSRI